MRPVLPSGLLLVLLLALAGCATSGDRPQTGPERASRINTQLGVEYLRQGELEQSMGRLRRAVAQDPRNPDAHAALAVLLERLGEDAEAGDHYRRALALAPDESSILNNYGRYLCERGEPERAEALFQQAVQNPLYRARELPLTNAGLCAQRAGEVGRAEQYFLRALEFNPGFPPALERMAQLRFDADHASSARGYYQRYLEVAPQTAQTLWLGINIERALGDRDAVASYSLLLKSRFPDSEQTRKLLEMERDER